MRKSLAANRSICGIYLPNSVLFKTGLSIHSTSQPTGGVSWVVCSWCGREADKSVITSFYEAPWAIHVICFPKSHQCFDFQFDSGKSNKIPINPALSKFLNPHTPRDWSADGHSQCTLLFSWHGTSCRHPLESLLFSPVNWILPKLIDFIGRVRTSESLSLSEVEWMCHKRTSPLSGAALAH